MQLLQQMVAKTKRYFFWFTLILGVSCQSKQNNELPKELSVEQTHQDIEIVSPIAIKEHVKLYNINGYKFELPSLFYIQKSVGPDFAAYYFKYPGARSAPGVYFGKYPQLTSEMTKTVMTIKGKNDLRVLLPPTEVNKIRETFDTIKNGEIYHKQYEELSPHPAMETSWFKEIYRKRDFLSITTEEREKYTIRTNYQLRGQLFDSTYIFQNYPLDNKNKTYDIIFVTKDPFHYTTHIFITLNRYYTYKEIDAFLEKLIKLTFQ